MANELQSLSKIFHDRLFRIPDYQRGYAWQQEQLVDFWDDLVNLQEGKNHYTGLLSLKPLKSSEIKDWGNDLWIVDDRDYTPYHIVDGQQRLTTFVILLNEIVEFVKTTHEYKEDPSSIVLGSVTLEKIVEKYICQRRPPHNQIVTYLFGYEKDNPSAEYLRYKIFNEEYSGTIEETYYTKNLKFAKQFFESNLSKLYNDNDDGIQAIDRLYKKLTLHMQFNIHEIADDYDVFVAFETMNNRGKKLTNLELLKNRLIYLTTLYSDKVFDEREKDNLRGKIRDAWKEVYRQLGRNIRTPLSDDEYLRAHWIIYFRYSRKKGDDYIRFLLSKFSAKNIYEKEPVTFAESANDSAIVNDPDSVNLESMSDDDTIENEQELFSKLQPSEISSYVLSLKDTAKYWYDSYFPYESTELTKDEKIGIDRLNRIGIGHFRPIVTAIIADKKTTPEVKVDALKAIEQFIFVCFRMGGFNASYKSSDYYRAARAVYVGEKSISEIASELNETVAVDSQYAIPNFITKIEKWFKDGSGYYGWGSLRYFMYEYEFYLKEKTGTEKITWEMFSKSEKEKVSIEHILPQTPTKYYWRNMFRQYTDEEIKQMSGAIGNLLPLSLSINKALQNDSFPEKKQAKDGGIGRRGYEDGSHSEIEVAKNDDWSAQNIYKRSKKLIDFLKTRWNIALTDEQESNLIFVNFAAEERDPVPELPEETKIVNYSDLMDSKPALSNTAEVLIEWCEEQSKKGIIRFSREHSSNSYIRFTTDGMNRFIPQQMDAISGWNSHDYYFYEINNHKEYFRLILSICSSNAPESLMEEFERLFDFYKPRRTKPDWIWRRLHSTAIADYDSNSTKEQIWQQLDKMLSEMLTLEEELLKARSGDEE